MYLKNLKIVVALSVSVYGSLSLRGISSLSTNDQTTSLALTPVHEASRVSHAKELLGSAYKKSDANKLEVKIKLNSGIYRKVKNSLPAQWKAQSRHVAEAIITESAKYSMDPVFVLAVIKTESKFNPTIIGRHGEIGLMQIKPSTATWIAQKYKIQWDSRSDLHDPSINIKLGLAYMDYLRNTFKRESFNYVSAYNMGPTNVRKLLASNIRPDFYNAKVMKNYRAFYSLIATSKSKPSFPMVAQN